VTRNIKYVCGDVRHRGILFTSDKSNPFREIYDGRKGMKELRKERIKQKYTNKNQKQLIKF